MGIIRPFSSQPIPKTAKKVFTGKLFNVFQWEQKQFDGSTKIFEKITRPDTVNVIAVTSDRKIIITRQEQPGIKSFYGLPGGIVELNEDPFTVARRELKEETGYESSDWKYWFGVQPANKVEWVIYTFIASGCELKQKQKLDSGEKIQLKLVDLSGFLDILAGDFYRDNEVALKIFKTIYKKKSDKWLSDLLFKNNNLTTDLPAQAGN